MVLYEQCMQYIRIVLAAQCMGFNRMDLAMSCIQYMIMWLVVHIFISILIEAPAHISIMHCHIDVQTYTSIISATCVLHDLTPISI